MTFSNETEPLRRVVVTGIGVVSPFGVGKAPFWEGMVTGASRVTPLPSPLDLLLPGYGGQVTAEWKDIRPLPGAKGHRPATMTRYTFLAVGAIACALEDAGMVPEEGDPERRGLYTGSYCNMDSMDKYIRFSAVVADRSAWAEGRSRIDDSRVMLAMKKFTGFDYLKLMNNMPTAHGGIQAGCRGPCNTFLGHAAAGIQAIGRAVRVIQDGVADVMVSGGVGASVHEHLLMVKGHRGLLSSPDAAPAEASRPFDEGATGQVPGEGGGYFVLEERERALQRGARIYGEICGFSDRFSPPLTRHGVPGPEAAVAGAREALAEAGVRPEEVDLVIPTGLSRPDLDRVESQALTSVLGPSAHEVSWTTVSPAMGFAEAANGPLSLATALLAMQEGRVPGARTTRRPIPGFVLPLHEDSREITVRTAWINAMSPEGGHASLIATAP